MKIRMALLLSGVVLSFSPTFGQGTSPPPERHAFFGELHLHTTMSFDAWTLGTKTTPDQAYKFARGETVAVYGTTARRAWPLDFTAVTDHSESMGVLSQLDDPHSSFAQTALGHQIIQNPRMGQLGGKMRSSKDLPPEMDAVAAIKSAWDIEQKAANDNYEPGKFTTFIAYEWTAMDQGRNLHRNVIFNTDRAPLPFSATDSERPEDLWTYLDGVRAQGIDVIAIPHNGDASGGLMYDWNNSDGKPIDEAYAQRRALNEPLTEIVQNKGQSDTVPSISPNDEFANFEIWDHLISSSSRKSNPHGSYIREAFGRGLIIQSDVGINPYKYGVVGGTDIHNGLTTQDENAFAGGAFGIDPGTMLPTGQRAARALGEGQSNGQADGQNLLEFSSGGLTGVWAEENNRASIFAALKRKETFATSGPPMRIRMFAGWDFDPKMLTSRDWPAAAYREGVPMGSDLPTAPAGASTPKFALSAVKGPSGANLDRIQIIKIWLDGADYKEKIFDVALSDKRKVNSTSGKAPAVGNTVDLKTAQYSNKIGATELKTVWQDPEFNPAKPAVYYARVLEIPTPRWSTILAVKAHLAIPDGAPATIQERAWSSPIWYTPLNKQSSKL